MIYSTFGKAELVRNLLNSITLVVFGLPSNAINKIKLNSDNNI